MQVSIVLPCLNEAENIEKVIFDVLRWFDSVNLDGEVIAVNDGSEDATGEIIDKLATQESRLIALHHDKNIGHGQALQTGFKKSTGVIMGMMDSDGQLHAEDYSKLMEFIDSFDVVVGYRKKRVDPFPRRVFMMTYALLVRILLGVKIKDVNCGIKIWKRDVWSRIQPKIATGGFFHAELFARCKKNNIKWKTVVVSHYPRLKLLERLLWSL